MEKYHLNAEDIVAIEDMFKITIPDDISPYYNKSIFSEFMRNAS